MTPIATLNRFFLQSRARQWLLSFSGVCLVALLSCKSAPTGSAPDLTTATTNSTPPTTIPRLQPRGVDLDKVITQFAVGSCADQDADQPIWSAISGSQPDLFLFIGDNVYASRPEQKPIFDQYKKLDRIEGYRRLRSQVPFLVTWDDHDFGQNDGGADNPEKAEARSAFLNYWRFVKDYLPLKLEDGIYYSKVIGPNKKQRVQFILLDTRSYRSPLKKNEDSSRPKIKFVANKDPGATLLGERQWAWLETQLKEPAEIRFLISSIQVVAEGHGYEKWANFPAEKKRLYNLLAKTKAKNVIVLSGDRHLSAIAKEDVKSLGPLYDFTASSLNRPSDLKESDPSYLFSPFTPENFGFVKIDWSNREVTLEVRDSESKGVQSAKVKLN